MIDVTTWTAHATREPSEDFLEDLDRRWRECVTSADCVWQTSPVHALALVHADRALHRRRLRARYIGQGTCDFDGEGHGFTPMSDLMPHDQYGPEVLDVRHAGDSSPLAMALNEAKSDPNLAAVTVFTEQQFSSVDTYLDHAASSLRPEVHGAVVPFLVAPTGETLDNAHEREDLLRANGFSTYTVDVSSIGADPIAAHRDLALVLEDVLDEIAQLKADGAARILFRDPLWPLVVIRGPRDWMPAHARSAR